MLVSLAVSVCGVEMEALVRLRVLQEIIGTQPQQVVEQIQRCVRGPKSGRGVLEVELLRKNPYCAILEIIDDNYESLVNWSLRMYKK